MTQKTQDYPFPPSVDGVQINYCRNPNCAQFGLPITDQQLSKQQEEGSVHTSGYLQRHPDTLTVSIRCQNCYYLCPARSNRAFVEEYKRLASDNTTVCPNEHCSNHQLRLEIGSAKGLYKSKGYTKAGAKRYQCLRCKKSFTVDSTGRRTPQKSKNGDLPKLITSGISLRRIGRELGIELPSVYYLIKQQAKELALANTAYIREELNGRQTALRLATAEIQLSCYAGYYVAIPFSIIGTICIDTGMILRLDMNYDASADAPAINVDVGSNSPKNGLSDFSRVWTWVDHANHATKPRSSESVMYPPNKDQVEKFKIVIGDPQPKTKSGASEYNERRYKYEQEFRRASQLPFKGMKVHKEYTLYAHMQLVKELLGASQIEEIAIPNSPLFHEVATHTFLDEIKAGQLRLTNSAPTDPTDIISSLCESIRLFEKDAIGNFWLRGKRLDVLQQALPIAQHAYNLHLSS